MPGVLAMSDQLPAETKWDGMESSARFTNAELGVVLIALREMPMCRELENDWGAWALEKRRSASESILAAFKADAEGYEP
jgi:hypothetical protein